MHEFSAGFLFCGLGSGALGFLEAAGRLGRETCHFTNAGGIDNDPEACEDFEYLTGGRATCADISAMTGEDIRAALGERRPDAVFTSPPCQGLSGLLSTENSQKQHYQDLNQLVLKGLFLICEAWKSPPPTIVLENVPRIQSRGANLLDQARQLMRSYGYVFDMATHDCGEIGGLAQHRKRFLMVARRPDDVPGYIYRPMKKRVRGCGEVLGDLPMPEDPAAGDLHLLPRLSWLNWVRLALIPAGGDWRDLPKGPVKVEQAGSDAYKGRPDAYGVQDWDAPAKTVRAKMGIAHSPAALADPRPFNGRMGVTGWGEPAKTVAGENYPSNGNFSVADPRLMSPVAEGEEKRAHFKRYHIAAWEEPVRCVAGSGTNGNYGVADPRLGVASNTNWHNGAMGVKAWDQPTGVVTGNGRPGAGAFSVADPRLGLVDNPGRHWNKYVIVPWEQPTQTVTGATRPGSGALGVADPRLGCKPRTGYYGVISWQEAAGTITGTARIDNGRFAVADPRRPPPMVPVIEAADGTWHRPLTTLELAALQGLPARVRGEPLKLAGDNIARWRKRIGNAVPVQAGTAIARTILTALLAGKLGCWMPGAGGVWVRKDGVTEDEANAEYEKAEDLNHAA